MELDALFKAVVTVLRAGGHTFAVAGGFAADVYRSEHRVTQDVDVLLVAAGHSLEIAEAVVRAVGLHPAIVRKADLAGGPLFEIKRGTSEPSMVVGRPEGKPFGAGVDILLPTMPWVPGAVTRAQTNCVDFGFGMVPCMTVEDVIIAKCAALEGAPARFKDLDDLSSIFSVAKDLDVKYLAGQMNRFGIVLPKVIRTRSPLALVSVSKDIERARRKKGRR